VKLWIDFKGQITDFTKSKISIMKAPPVIGMAHHVGYP